MASNMEGSNHRGCDFIFDFSCFTCQENDRNTETDVVEQEKCKKHRKEKLTIFCEDHSELICHVCHFHSHQ
ncbi:hypothetical protein DPMN_062975 [Dreissena polymorpha]|uniref:B box-type domain-containing protein n=1 Tax=Dreissena polymorpha TaxID=45954 RepID=A0A9D4CAE5_DREPO|nr:hypothetical protein DPMN_062975 [Dreissena polymorpha]